MLFKRKVAELNVYFYDDPKDDITPSKVYVSYGGSNISTEQLASHFVAFSIKVMYNLGDHPQKYWLLSILNSLFKKGITKNDNLKVGSGYSFNFVNKQPNYTKYSKAIFYDNTIKTYFSIGKESYFAPISVLAFLQYIIDNSSEEALIIFNQYLSKVAE